METEEKHKCPPHHFRVDSYDVGHCIYCPEVRDFRALQRGEERAIAVRARLGKAASIGVPRKHYKRGRAHQKSI